MSKHVKICQNNIKQLEWNISCTLFQRVRPCVAWAMPMWRCIATRRPKQCSLQQCGSGQRMLLYARTAAFGWRWWSLVYMWLYDVICGFFHSFFLGPKKCLEKSRQNWSGTVLLNIAIVPALRLQINTWLAQFRTIPEHLKSFQTWVLLVSVEAKIFDPGWPR